MKELHTILCPVDFSPSSLDALGKAVELAALSSAQLLLLHVIDLVPASGPGVMAFEPTRLVLEHEQAVRERLLSLCAEFEPKLGRRIDHWIVGGAPHELIIRATEERKADLIVMGHGSHTGVWRLLGSVAERVVRRAPCPVLICPLN